MVKYLFKVYDRKENIEVCQVITSINHMLDTIKIINELGMVKGFILDDKENENDN